ncbi:MAG: PH domain-containing protein [Pseudomonadota bacterium]
MTGTWRRTSPVAVVFFLTKALKFLVTDGFAMLAPAVAWYATASDGMKVWAAVWFAALAAVGAVWAVLSYLRFRYQLTDSQVLVRRGVIQREQLNIDFDRVQDTSIDEPFYVRPFGLAVLKLDTAGSAQKEIALAGIGVELANQIRNTLLSFQPKTPDPASETAAGAPTDAPVLLERSNRQIVRYGLTANGLLWVAVAFGVLAGALGEEAWETAGKFVLERLRMGTLLETGGPARGLLLALGVLAVPVLLALFSIIGALWRYANYQLIADGGSFRRSSGLVSRQQQTLKGSKVQAAVWKQNAIARLLRITNLQLRLVSAGQEVNSSGMPASTPAFLVPALSPNEVVPVTKEFLPDTPAEEPVFTGINRAYHLKRSLWYWLAPVGGITLGLSFAVGFYAAIVPLLGLTLAVFCIRQRSSKFGVSIIGATGYLRSGFIGTHTAVFSLFKVQRVDVCQSPGQRKRSLATLNVHLASHTITIPHLTLSDAQRFADLALYHVESSTRPWF